MTADEWRANMLLIYSAAKVVEQLPVAEMIEESNKAHTLAPFLDPTLYIEKATAMRQDLQMLRAANEFKKLVMKIREEAER